MSSTTKQLIFGVLFVFLAGLLVVALSGDFFMPESQEQKKDDKQPGTTSDQVMNLKGIRDRTSLKQATQSESKIIPATSTGVDLVKLDSPEGESTITSPLKVEGKARGIWFIDGGFPVYLRAGSGEVIASTTANPSTGKKGFATSTDFVFFQAELEFQKPSVEEAKLILEEPGVSGFSTEPAKKKIKLYFEN